MCVWYSPLPFQLLSCGARVCGVCCCWAPVWLQVCTDHPTCALHVCCMQEHQGNDPTTQLVEGGAGWRKPEEPQPQQPQAQSQPEVHKSALTAGSNWASSGGTRSSSSGWVPPAREGPFAGTSAPRGSFPVERHLNPEEYPSLAATSQDKPASKRQQFEQQARGPSQVCVVEQWVCGGWFSHFLQPHGDCLQRESSWCPGHLSIMQSAASAPPSTSTWPCNCVLSAHRMLCVLLLCSCRHHQDLRWGDDERDVSAPFSRDNR